MMVLVFSYYSLFYFFIGYDNLDRNIFPEKGGYSLTTHKVPNKLAKEKLPWQHAHYPVNLLCVAGYGVVFEGYIIFLKSQITRK